MKNLFEKGYARQVEPQELEQHLQRKWYLPVFPVINPNKPGKPRMVFDAAATVKDVSLNSVLLKGPDLNSSLIGVLLRFRQRKIAVSGDIREMFLQVKIAAPDCYSQLFLYREKESMQPRTCMLTSMTFGSTSSPTCAQFVMNHNARMCVPDNERVIEAITRNHYVDDWLDSIDSDEEAMQLITQVKEVQAKAGFEIRGWKSNSTTVMNNFGDKEEDLNLQMNAEDMSEKVLGTWWVRRSDALTYSLKFNKGSELVLAGKIKPTKAEILRVQMSLYDPLGLLINFISILKVLMQDIWRSKVNWEDQISDEHHQRWLKWLNSLKQVEKLSIPRCYISNLDNYEAVNVQLHVFCDASKDCSATVAYLRTQRQCVVEVSIVMAKSRVAPISLSTIPRLELVAALLGARLGNTIQRELTIKIDKIVYWTDSTTVLHWLRSDTRKIKGQYEKFRVAEIQETTIVNNWRYVPTKLNVADEATKVKSYELSSDDRWFTGPSFLELDEKEWPNDIMVRDDTVDEQVHVAVVFKPIIMFENYSNWDRLVRIVTLARGYVSKLRLKVNKQDKATLSLVNKFNDTEKFLITQIQKEAYANEIATLNKAKNPYDAVVDKKSKIYQFDPILVDGVLKSNGRTVKITQLSPYVVNESQLLPEEVSQRIILPKEHAGTKLIVRKYHEKYWHVNHETALNEVRQRYQIGGLRQLLKSLRRTCPKCMILNAKPIVPKMGDLPLARLAVYTRPFTYTGVDCLGPMNVAVGRRQEKRWIVLFTCLTTRAIHLEILHGMDHDAFIMAFRMFMARRGQPNEMFSDNGTNFVKAERILREDIQERNKKLEPEMAMKKIVWHFNPPDASHMGGAWERLVKSVKLAYYASMPTRSISDPLFRAMMAEIENMINSRPLTYIPVSDENEEILTPNHFLLGSSSGMKPLGQFSDNAVLLRSNWLNAQLYTKKFWNVWIDNYLPTITCRSKWHIPQEPLKVNDFVLIADETKPNYEWTKGIVTRVNTSSDGQVRSAIVKTPTGFLTRPTVKLAKINIKESGPEGSTGWECDK